MFNPVDYFFWIFAESRNVLIASEVRWGRYTMTFAAVYRFLLHCNWFISYGCNAI
jgi:hypothetical protein